MFDESGAITGVFGISFDISRLKETECCLRREQKMAQLTLKTIISALPGHIYWQDKNGVYLGCNELQVKSLGLSSSGQVVGKTDYELSTKALADEYRKVNFQVMETRKEQSLEENAYYQGQNRVFLTHKKPLLDEQNEVVGVLGVSIDITERKQAEAALKTAKEAAEAALLAKTDFLENMRHDIRTPLSGIIGFAELIKQEAEEKSHPQYTKYADGLITSGNALLTFLNEVLETIKLGSGLDPIEKKKFALQTEIQKVIDLYQSLAHKKKLSLLFSHDEAIPKYFLGDSHRIYRILLELLANALTFTQEGRVIVRTKLAKSEGNQSIVKITVEDTGIGIKPEHYQAIFEQFKRLTPSWQGVYNGLGMGLAVVRQYIDELDAEIYVDSVPERGTTFTCVIPLQRTWLEEGIGQEAIRDEFIADTAVYTREPPAVGAKKVLPSCVILLVEDDPFAATIAASLLNHHRCTVDLACDGETALEKAKENSYDLMLLDIGLPDMPGYEVARQIRAMEAHKTVRMVALTAHVEPEQEQCCFDAGISQIFNKPLTREKIEQLLSSPEAEVAREGREEAIPAGDFIDIPYLVKCLGLKGTALQDILLLYNKSLSDELPLIQAAYQEKNWKELKRLVHKMKGGAMFCRAARIQKACEFLEEKLARNKGKRGIATPYEALGEEIQRVKGFVKGFFENRDAEVTV